MKEMTSGSVWGTANVSSKKGVSSLSDVMSEELAIKLQGEEDAFAEKLRIENASAAAAEEEILRAVNTVESINEGDTSKDLELARMLQAQFDAEAHEALQNDKLKENLVLNFKYKDEEPMINGDSDHRGRTRLGVDDAEGEDGDEDDSDSESLGVREAGPAFSCSSKGYSGRGQNIRTKHDLETAARRNANRMIDCMGPAFNSGDVVPEEHQISDQVYNALRNATTESDHKRVARLQEKKDHSTATCAVDKKTREILYRFETQDHLRELGGVIATGKESVVLFARGGKAQNHRAETRFPEECAVKIFKTTLNEFKTRSDYVVGDFRFVQDEFKKLNSRKVIRIWAEKELINLKKIFKSGIPCPKPVHLSKHVLVMSFIGSNGHPAPQLSDAVLSPEDWEDAYDQTLKCIRRLYDECSLVHADLSSYNLLWHEDQVWVIDVSQAVVKNHPRALQFLRRDLQNVTTFFKKKGVHAVADWEDLFNSVTGLAIEGRGDSFLRNLENYLAVTQDYEANETYLTAGVHRREFAFDHFFRLSSVEAGQGEKAAEEQKKSSSSYNKSSHDRRE